MDIGRLSRGISPALPGDASGIVEVRHHEEAGRVHVELARVGDVLRRARHKTGEHPLLRKQRPTLLEMVTDPDVPPLPPHIQFKQAKAYMSALLHRDPDAIGPSMPQSPRAKAVGGGERRRHATDPAPTR